MSKKHKPHHSDIKRVEEAAAAPVEPDLLAVAEAEARLDLALAEPLALGTPKPSQTREEYLVQEVHYGDLQSRLNQLAAEGRWRLHSVNLSGTYCRYILVRSV